MFRVILPRVVRWCSVFALVVTSCFSLWATDPEALCDCENPQAIRTILICLNNVNYPVQVFGCQQIGTPLLGEVCNGSGQQNRYTTITKVCFTGTPPATYTAQAVMDAVLCTMTPCAGNMWGISVPPIANQVYCWTIATPKCVRINVSTNCIERCDEGCCVMSVRWKVEPPPVGCVVDAIWKCDVEGECDAGCIELTCPDEMPTCCVGS